MDVIMPQLGETVLEGTIAAWHKKVGDTVKADEPLFDVETDKVTAEIPAPASGVLAEVLVGVNTPVKVGTRLAVIAAAGAVASPVPPQPADAAVPRLSPVVRRLLAEHGVHAQAIAGTGRNGRITRENVLAYLADVAARPPAREPADARATAAVAAQAPPARVATPADHSVPAPAAPMAAGADDRVVPLSKIRRITAAHMVRSVATSPHTLQAVEVDFGAVDRVRRTRGAEWKAREGFSLTYLPFVARAVCAAIARFPYVNASFGDDELIVHNRVHLAIAVDLDHEGLVATVVRDADHRNLRGLALEIHRLADAARRGALRPDELAGGTYTISNSGTFGTFFSAPIINQPQAAILSTDAVRKKPVVIEGPAGDAIAIRPIGVLAQTFDHRAFDGAYSAAFLQCLKEILETRDWEAEVA